MTAYIVQLIKTIISAYPDIIMLVWCYVWRENIFFTSKAQCIYNFYTFFFCLFVCFLMVIIWSSSESIENNRFSCLKNCLCPSINKFWDTCTVLRIRTICFAWDLWKWLGLVNMLTKIYQALLDFKAPVKAPLEIWNPLSNTELRKCNFVWKKRPVNIWNIRKAQK